MLAAPCVTAMSIATFRASLDMWRQVAAPRSTRWLPAAADALIQADDRREPVGARLHERKLRREELALRVKLLEIGRITRAVAVRGGGQHAREGVALGGDHLLLRGIAFHRGERILHLAERSQRGLAIGVGR